MTIPQRDIQILIGTSATYPTTISTLSSLLGPKLRPTGADRTSVWIRLLGIEFILFENTLENDQGIPFESYQFVLDLVRLTIGANVDEYAHHMRASANFLAVELSKSLTGETRVVENLQTTLAVYEKGRSLAQATAPDQCDILILIKTTASLRKTIQTVSELLGIPLARTKESAQACLLETQFTLSTNTFTDNQGIPFESYQYVLEVARLKPADTSDHEYAQHMRSSARFVAIILSEYLKGETRVVENLQTTLAVYKLGKNDAA